MSRDFQVFRTRYFFKIPWTPKGVHTSSVGGVNNIIQSKHSSSFQVEGAQLRSKLRSLVQRSDCPLRGSDRLPRVLIKCQQ